MKKKYIAYKFGTKDKYKELSEPQKQISINAKNIYGKTALDIIIEQYSSPGQNNEDLNKCKSIITSLFLKDAKSTLFDAYAVAKEISVNFDSAPLKHKLKIIEEQKHNSSISLDQLDEELSEGYVQLNPQVSSAQDSSNSCADTFPAAIVGASEESHLKAVNDQNLWP